MRLTAGLVFIAGLIASTFALKEAPEDLQIGVLRRVPAAECTIKSKNGDKLSMHYTGTLFSTGAKFDSSVDRNQPFDFTIGVGQVIQGWEKGLIGMCIGEKRKLVIPPAMGYGDNGAGNVIPGGATLVFEVELLNIERKSAPASAGSSPVVASDDNIISFTSPSFILSTAAILGLFFFIFKLAKKQDIVEAKKAKVAEIKEKK